MLCIDVKFTGLHGIEPESCGSLKSNVIINKLMFITERSNSRGQQEVRSRNEDVSTIRPNSNEKIGT